ncbi:MAG: ATP-binding cassette domain-containing protein [Pirellulales bacterium]
MSKSKTCGRRSASDRREPRCWKTSASQSAQGEFVALYGRLGDGKTTLASLVAGLTLPDYGSISLAGKCVSGPGPDRSLMSQAHAPLAWLSVRENVIAAIDAVYSSPTERRTRADYYLKTLGLAEAAAKKPSDLAEPLRRRLALARALAVNPDVLLLDDPLCGLNDGPRNNCRPISRGWSPKRTRHACCSRRTSTRHYSSPTAWCRWLATRGLCR